MPRHQLRSVFTLIFILAATACDSGTATPSVPPATSTPASTATAVAAATTQPASPTALIPSSTGTSSLPISQPALTPADTQKVAPGCPADRLTNSPRDGLGDDLFPKLGNAGYDVQHYDLDLTVDVQKDTLNAKASLTIVALKDFDTFNLDFRGLTISKVTVNDADANFTRDEHELTVTMPAGAKSGQTFTLDVAYSGEPISASRNGSPTEGWTDYNDGVYVAGEPDGASTVYPVNEHPCDKATYSLKVTVPKPYVVASVGHLDSTTDDGPTSTYTWSTKNPVASYLVGLNIGLFDIEKDQSPDGVQIRSYFPKDLPAEVRDTFSRTPEMVQFLSDTFGPYPFEEYGVVVADTSLGFALETQTMSLFGNDIGTGRNPGDETALHELAHQWFGDSVSLEQWHDIWLNEGFATYAQWLWIEHNQGKQALEDRVRLMYSVVNEEHGIPPGSPTAETLFNPGVYLRGGLTLQALRLKVGDDAFFKILKTYAARYRHSNATTEDFIAVSEEVSGMQLDDLFDSWLHDAQMPSMPELGLSTPNSSVPPSATVGSASTAPVDLPASGAWQRIDTTANTICARGTPYAFWARAGTVNKLLVYFQGGGGCWNYDTCKPGSTFFNDSVSAGSDPSYNGGMLDLTNPDNPFKDYNVVYVPYCTGDVHMGSYTQTYKSSTGEQVTIKHNGFVNSSAAVQWAYEHFVAPDSVFVAGCSAGSIGSIVFAPYLIKHYDNAVVAQLGDSESFTFDHPVDLQTDWHAHDNFPNWIPEVAGIKPGTFTMSSFYAAIANFYPNNTFSQYNSAHDTVQQRYYFAAALPTSTPPTWEEAFQRNLAEIHAAAPNFRSYTSDGSNHCVTPTPGFYTMSQDGVSLRDWIASIANSTPVPNVGQ